MEEIEKLEAQVGRLNIKEIALNSQLRQIGNQKLQLLNQIAELEKAKDEETE